MTDKCPECGVAFEGKPKYCPSCGAAQTHPDEQPYAPVDSKAQTTEPSAELLSAAGDAPPKKRMFVERERAYGDTAEYDDPREYEHKKPDPAQPSAKSTVSLYLSIVAIVLSVTAIALVIIFAVTPSDRRTDNDDASAKTDSAKAPTMAPTEPPIVGIYQLDEIKSEETGLGALFLKGSRIEMHSDYTGTLRLGTIELGDVILEKDSDKAVFMGIDCTYSFNGKRLTIDYPPGETYVYQKEQ